MRPASTIVALAGVVALAGAWDSGHVGFVGAQEESTPAKSARGGIAARTARYQFEVFFYPSGARVLPRTAAGGPVDLSRATGTATFYHPDSPQPWFSRPLRGTTGQEPATLDLLVGLGNAPATGAKATFELAGLPDPAEPAVTFTVPLEFVATPPATSPPRAMARPTPPQGRAATVPRYVYRPGYYGYGYYSYSRPSPTSPPASAYHTYSTPRRHYRGGGDSVGPGHRDWATGRDIPLARPWLRPMD